MEAICEAIIRNIYKGRLVKYKVIASRGNAQGNYVFVECKKVGINGS